MLCGCFIWSLPIIVLYSISIIPDTEAEPRIFEEGLNSTSTVKNSTYENSTLGIQIEYPNNWKPFEKTSTTTNASIVEFIPFVESEHDPLTPFFSISIEDLDEVRMSQKLGNESELSIGSNNSNALKVLTERNLELAKSLPDFDIVGLNSTSTLSGIPAYKIVYTFADPGSPLLSLFESMNIWTAQDDKALLFPILHLNLNFQIIFK